MSLDELIEACIASKRGNREFALFYLPEEGVYGSYWRAEIGNPAGSVMLGESSGEVTAEGPTPREAVERLLGLLSARRWA